MLFPARERFSSQREIPHPATLGHGPRVTGTGGLILVVLSGTDNIFGRENEEHSTFFWPLVNQLRWVM